LNLEFFVPQNRLFLEIISIDTSGGWRGDRSDGTQSIGLVCGLWFVV